MGQSKSKMLSPDAISVKKKGFLYYLKRDWQLYALMLLPMAFIIVFKYFAYTGLSVAFLDYKIGKGYAGSKFVGLKVFEKVFKHRDFGKAVANTLLLNVLDLLFSFPMPIILALLLNEIRVKWFKRVTQTLLYLPHFLSWVVIGATAYAMFATNSGVINTLIANAGKSPIPFLQEDAWWLFSYILSSESGRRWAGARSSIWPPSPMSTLSCMRLPRSMVPTAGSNACMSHCPASARPS